MGCLSPCFLALRVIAAFKLLQLSFSAGVARLNLAGIPAVLVLLYISSMVVQVLFSLRM